MIKEFEMARMARTDHDHLYELFRFTFQRPLSRSILPAPSSKRMLMISHPVQYAIAMPKNHKSHSNFSPFT